MKILPDGYTQLEYIRSSGAQYINTGINPNQDTRVVIELEAPFASNTPCAFGCVTTSPSVIVYAFQILSDGYRNDYYNTVDTMFTTNISGRFVVDKNKSVQTMVGVSDDAGYQPFAIKYPIYLFARNINGGVDEFASIPIYYCQIIIVMSL